MSVWVKAAESVANKEGALYYCCEALRFHDGSMELSRTGENVVKLEKIFKPRDLWSYQPWFGKPELEENQIARSLALLFMDELEKDGLL